MAEVSNNATRGDVLSSEKKSGAPAFDLRSWQGLTDVLRLAREAGLSDAAYGEFRNLVLGYAQSGGSSELRAKIDAYIARMAGSAAMNVSSDTPKTTATVPTVESKAQPPAEAVSESMHPETGSVASSEAVFPASIKPPAFRRPAPSFMPKRVGAAGDDSHDVSVTTDTPPLQKEPAAPPAPPNTPLSTEMPFEVVDIAAPLTTQVSEPVPAVSEKVIAPPVATPHEGFKTLDAYKERIAEIKRSINSEVGNPIMLVDAGVPVGREYMGALLTAMKASGNGGQGLDEAMVALEAAYVRVLDIVAKKRSNESASVTETAPVVDATVSEQRVASETGAANESAQKAVFSNDVSAIDIANSGSADGPVGEESVLSSKKDSLPNDGLLEESVSAANAPQDARQAEYPDESAENTLTQPQSPRTDQAVAVTNSPTAAFRNPTVDIEPLDHSPLEIATRQSELMSKEITTALSQLLHEWSLFAGSGLFGIGPGGMDHPLYKKLAGLSMGEVLSGRFEGATPDLRRTLTDYVDAWRHEQGVAYNPTETFEHYLRRVVQRILKRQKGESPA